VTTERVLHITNRASSRGGADRYLLGFVEAFAERGVEQIMAVGRDDGSARFACETTLVPGLDDAFSFTHEAHLDALVRAFRPTVVHVHNAIAPEVLRWVADRAGIATVQDHRSFCPGRGKLTLARAACRDPMAQATCAGCFTDADYHARIHAITEARREAFSRMQALTVLSRYMQAELARVGVPGAHVIPPFVHGLDRAAAPDGPPCALFAGRLVEHKGVMDALEAWCAAEIDLPLVFAGSGPLRSTLEAHTKNVLGWVPHARMSAIYRRARALVMPSRWQEPFGIVGLEATWMGVPVAAWESGGVAEWHRGGALLTPWGDIGALARAIRIAVDGGAEAGRSPTTAFEREPLVDRMLALYVGARAKI
jgi:glycosyltransferase involved in cell wall biosynthesis